MLVTNLIVALSGEATLDAPASVDWANGPDPLAFSWSFVSKPDGSGLMNIDIDGATMPNAKFTPDLVGLYVLRVDVTDGIDSDFDHTAGDVGALPTQPLNLIGRAKRYHVNVRWSDSAGATLYHVFHRLNTEEVFTELGATEQVVFVDDMPPGTISAD